MTQLQLMNNSTTTYINLNYKISQLKKEEILIDPKLLYFYEITPSSISQRFDFDYILIKNYYTASINILQFHNCKWKTILSDYKIMTDTDTDEEAEKYSLIDNTNFNNFKEDSTILRIYLTQECKDWKSFHLSEIKFIKEENVDSPNYSDKIKFNQEDSIFYFGNLKIFHDKEEINRKYIEISKLNSLDELKLNFLN